MQPNKPLQVTRVQSGSDKKCCGISFLRHLLYVFNALLLLSGMGVLAVGLFAFFVTHRYAPILGGHMDYFMISIYILVVTGGLTIVVVFVVGCCATCQKNKTCLMLYSVLLLMVLLLETGAGVIAYVYEALVKSKLALKLNNAMMQSYLDVPSIKTSVDHLQSTFRCCGLSSYADWKKSAWYSSPYTNPSNASVPDSCCKTWTDDCGVNSHPSNIYTAGCEPIFKELIHEQLIIIGGVGLGLCCLQIFGIISSCCLAKKIRKWKARQNPYWE